MAFLAFLVSCLVKKDRPEQESKSFMAFRSKGKSAKKRKMFIPEKGEEEDIQRQIMIRKSLASRTSSRTTDEMYNHNVINDTDDGDVDHNHTNTINNNNENNTGLLEESEDSEEELENGNNAATLKSDWKAYEADLQRNRSVLIRRHPGIDRSVGGPSNTHSPTNSPRVKLAPRQHTFHTIPRKPLPMPSDIPEERPTPLSMGRAFTHG